ncbi:site-2 protease family protein [Nocardioides sp. BP30]|uniref:site-2 protease family protein n=1 Tax=Nocardioides sp. BP30 TaxID=3036374 RepID=UPI00246824DE|nr:site-2 protease family protein [Nocardioides sp. BP30]WGL50777.1 site-2 protease family protein [Nocardioides sp. BP30]
MADHRPRPPQRQLPPGVVRLGSIAGSDVLVTPSWFLIAGLIVVIISPVIEDVQPGLGALKYLAGFVFAVMLYGAVLVHEAAHAVVATRLGYPVGPITIHFLGGATQVEEESRRPRDEFLIAVVGPLASLLIAGVGALLWWAGPDGLLLFAVQFLAGANLFVGVLNLVPGLPLDGGRVMRAAVWGATRSMHRGTLVAGWIGRVVAVCVVAWPFVAQAVTGHRFSLYDLMWAFLLGMFLWSGASASMSHSRLQQRLPSLVARDLARRTLAVPADLPLAEAVRRAQEDHAGAIVTVTATGAPIGLVNEAALLATPPERRPWLPTSAVARGLTDGLSLPATIHGEDLIRALGATPSPEYLLLEDDGSIFGVLATADVDAAFRQGGR